MASLYKLTGEMRELLSMAENGDEGFAEALRDTMDAQSEMIDEKIEATIFVAKSLEADAEACENEAKRLMDRAKRLKGNASTCKQRVLEVMQLIDKTKIKRPLISVTVAKGRAVAEIENEALLSEQYVVTRTSSAPDKKAILQALQGGKEVLGAKLTEGNPSLRIS